MIKYGFLIENGKIYDTKIQSYVLKKDAVDMNIIYSMKPNLYKRLYLFEPLLDKYDTAKVFEILNYNKYLSENRASEKLIKTNKLHYMTNMAVIYNYPPTYLTQRKFALYKICQVLKKRLD